MIKFNSFKLYFYEVLVCYDYIGIVEDHLVGTLYLAINKPNTIVKLRFKNLRQILLLLIHYASLISYFKLTQTVMFNQHAYLQSLAGEWVNFANFEAHHFFDLRSYLNLCDLPNREIKCQAYQGAHLSNKVKLVRLQLLWVYLLRAN